MADAFVREYQFLAKDDSGATIHAGQEPAVAGQSVTYTTSTASSAFNGRTRFIRVMSEADAWVDFGASPTAVKGDGVKINADVEYYFGVTPGHKIAFYDGSS